MRTHHWLGLGFFVSHVILMVLPEAAAASCVAPEPDLLWSYPADGDEDVPIDAQIWLLGSTWGVQPEVTLNDRSLQVESGGPFGALTIDPGALDPDTDYVLRLEFAIDPGDPNDAGRARFEVGFRTGSAQAQPPAKPVVSGHDATMGIDPMHACVDVINAQDCFDTGQDTLWSFATAGDDAIAWLVASEHSPGALWPKRCGDPSLFSYPDAIGCVEIRAIGSGGKLSEAASYCRPPPETGSEPDASVIDAAVDPKAGSGSDKQDPSKPGQDAGAKPSAAAEEGGCRAAGEGASSSWLSLGLALIALRSRRRRRAR